MLLNTVDTKSAGGEALKEALDKSSEVLRSMRSPEERRIVQRLLDHASQNDGLAIAGLDLVVEALTKGQAEVALVTDSTDMIDVIALCKKCSLPRTKIVHQAEKVQTIQEMISTPCKKCNAVEYKVEERGYS
jgi:peptide chain release factor subunit 1